MNVRIHCNVEVNITDTDADTNNVVYLLTFENGKYYVGLTTQKLIERISAHCSNAFNLKNTKYKTKVYGAIRKYMKFTATILYVGDNLEEKSGNNNNLKLYNFSFNKDSEYEYKIRRI